MTAFEYTITDSIGIHARPAGMLAKEAAKYKSKVFLHFGDKKADARRLIAIMGMASSTAIRFVWKSRARTKRRLRRSLRHFSRRTCKE